MMYRSRRIKVFCSNKPEIQGTLDECHLHLGSLEKVVEVFQLQLRKNNKGRQFPFITFYILETVTSDGLFNKN